MKITIEFDPETEYWKIESTRGEQRKYWAMCAGIDSAVPLRSLRAAIDAAGLPQFLPAPATEMLAAA
jgi:hypothetical protein